MSPPYELRDKATGQVVAGFDNMDAEPGKFIEVYKGDAEGSPNARISGGAIKRPEGSGTPPDPIPPDPTPIPPATGKFADALKAAFTSGSVLNWTDGPVTLDGPIVLRSQGNIIGFGLRGNGMKIRCNFPGGGGFPIHLLIDDAGHNIRQFRLQDFTVEGSGHEGAIKMECNRNDSWIYSGEINNVKCEGHSKHAVYACGSVFEFDCTSIGSEGGLGLFRATERGAKASDPEGTDGNRGLPSAMTGSDWRPRDFHGDAILLDSSTRWRECYDLTLEKGYIVTGQGPGYGINAMGGITKVRGVGFENFAGSAAVYCGYRGGIFEDCRTANASNMKYFIEAELTGALEIRSCSVENENQGTGIRLASVKDLQGGGRIILDPGSRSDPHGNDIDTTFTGDRFVIARYDPRA